MRNTKKTSFFEKNTSFSKRAKGDDKDLTQEQDICRHVEGEFLYPVVYLL
jgi:hypothetical protein